jgi:hypothetical protein
MAALLRLFLPNQRRLIYKGRTRGGYRLSCLPSTRSSFEFLITASLNSRNASSGVFLTPEPISYNGSGLLANKL